MSQYLNQTYLLINYILAHVFISVAYCENQTFKTFIANSDQNFTTIVDKFFRSESIHQNIADYNIFSHDYNTHIICSDDKPCRTSEVCCQVSDVYPYNNNKMCIHTDISGRNCRGILNQNCSSNRPCESGLGLECLPRPTSSPQDNPPKQIRGNACQCPDGKYFDFSTDKSECVDSTYDSKTAMEIYKITMIFASCCLALILVIFLVCILRKSYCPPRQRPVQPLDNSTIPDIFTLFPHVGNYDGGPLGDGTLPPFEKPPTYDETLTLIRNEIGIPPPAYRRNPNSSSNGSSSGESTPDMSARLMVSRPQLVTVSDQTNSSYLTTSSSSEASIAGPSGECRSSRGGSAQGIDNPAFC